MSVPALRFKDESGRDFPEWKDIKISGLNLYISDGNYGEQYPTSDQMVSSGVPFIRANNIKEQKLVWDDMKFITPDHHKILTSGHLLPNDILITTRGEIGTVALVQDEFGGSNINAQICLLRVNDTNELAPEFLLQELTTNHCQKQFKELQTGSALKQLPKSSLGKVSIKTPSLDEQTKIANFLTAVDEKISLLNQKYDLLAQYKKGVMQQIFSQELRFKDDDGQDFPEWKELQLGDVAEIIMGQSPDSKSYNDIGEGVPLIQGNADITNRQTSPRAWTTAPTKKSLINDIILTVRAPVGSVAVSKHVACIGRGVCAIRNNEKSISDYIYQLLLWYEPTKWVSLEQGSTFTAVSGKDIKTIDIPLPTLKEQTKIANFLTAIDDKITQTQAELDAVKQYKQGLLQQMFV